MGKTVAITFNRTVVACDLNEDGVVAIVATFSLVIGISVTGNGADDTLIFYVASNSNSFIAVITLADIGNAKRVRLRRFTKAVIERWVVDKNA